MKYTLAFIILTISSPVYANCIGTDAFKTCYDGTGNSYTVNKLGSSTYLDGYNAQTGSTWSQQSHTFGNTTQHTGTTNGNNWNMTQTQNGFGQTFSGTDSDGNSFFKTCDTYGNCY